ncbi:MAG: heat-inducible transcriptional repressor HrcA [Erysipelotrichaceae bacterium]|nr:heat-inducible transcriptional repressor HrcA [Erysipelotrichaceae bacterium]
MMTQRMVEILKAIVDEFVDTAEPVASKTLVDKYKLPYSSATIRNDMAILEAEGFIEKPHTSAGRIPSNKGYKYYCEHLLNKNMDDEIKYAVSNIFSDSGMNVEDCVKQSCRMISDMTNLTSGVLGPSSKSQTLEHISVFPLDNKTAVCIFITNTGHTENKTFNFHDEISAEDIKTCTDILNDRLKGTPISELKEKLESIKPILVGSVKRHEMLFNAFIGAFTKFASEKLYFSGTSKLMYQPEYSDIEKLKNLISIFDNPERLKEVVAVENNDPNMTAITTTGAELIWKDDMAIVTTEIKLNRSEIGRLMVVGPRRMEYNRVLALMDFISKQIENIYK